MTSLDNNMADSIVVSVIPIHIKFEVPKLKDTVFSEHYFIRARNYIVFSMFYRVVSEFIPIK